jgi:ureidoacrylate peracid hydrolase
MPRFRINPKETALILVDLQNAFLQHGGPLERPGSQSIVGKLNDLITTSRSAGIKVIFTRQAFRHDGSDAGLFREFVPLPPSRFALLEGNKDTEFYNGIDRQDDDLIITKSTYSALCGTDLDVVLRGLGINTLIVGGVDTAVCCEATARDARHLNYRVVFLSDGTATRDLPDRGWGVITAQDVQKTVLTLMAFSYAEVASVEEVINRINNAARNEGSK